MKENFKKRMVVGRRHRRQKAPEISQQDLSTAVSRFLEEGGLINRLPAELSSQRKQVTTHLDTAYEVVLDY